MIKVFVFCCHVEAVRFLRGSERITDGKTARGLEKGE
jgi:hypothetical protein